MRSLTKYTGVLACMVSLVAGVAVLALLCYLNCTRLYDYLAALIRRENLLAYLSQVSHSPTWVAIQIGALCVFGGIAVVIVYLAGKRGAPVCSPRNLSWLALFLVSVWPSPLVQLASVQQVLGTAAILAIGLGLYPFRQALANILQDFFSFVHKAICASRIQLLLLAAFSFVFVSANLASYLLFDHAPHIQDSADQLFHAKIFLEGRLYVPSPEIKEAFNFDHMINNGRWYSQYPPGHSLLLALGLVGHCAWLVNPLSGALSCLLLYFLGKEMFDENVGRVAVVLAAASPFLIFMSSEFMNHCTALLFWEIGLLGYVRVIKNMCLSDALMSGVGFGWCYLIRPLTAVSMLAPLIVYAAVVLVRARTRGNAPALARALTVCASVGAVFLAAQLLFNYLTNGSPWLTGYEVCWGKGHLPGFGHSGWGPVHTPELAWIQTSANLSQINLFLQGWPLPALLLVSLGLAFGRRTDWDCLLAATAGSLCLGYYFYWFADSCFGPRLIYECSAALWLLVARTFVQLFSIVTTLAPAVSRSSIVTYATTLLLVSSAYAIFGHVIPLTRAYSNKYWGTDSRTVQAIKAMAIHRAIVFVKSSYGSVFAENAPLLNSDIIYARDLGSATNRQVARSYPGRVLYLADGAKVAPYQPAD